MARRLTRAQRQVIACVYCGADHQAADCKASFTTRDEYREGPQWQRAKESRSRAGFQSILDTQRVKSPEVDLERDERRALPRRGGIVLTSGERERATRLIDAAAGCRSHWVAARRVEYVPGGAVEHRVCLGVPCGTRHCPQCDQERRSHAADELLGDWTQFGTLTVPASKISAADAWRQVSAWIGAFWREMRREHDGGSQVKSAAGTLDYAWCIEDHKSGYPHVHFVSTTKWLGYDWLRDLWARITGLGRSWCHVSPVKDPARARAYLTKYATKGRLSLDVLAIMFRRRIWTCTFQRPAIAEVEEPPKWFLERGISSEGARHEHLDSLTRQAPDGWRLKAAKCWSFSHFTRQWVWWEVSDREWRLVPEHGQMIKLGSDTVPGASVEVPCPALGIIPWGDALRQLTGGG